MSDLNCCQFIGRLGRDPESRYIPSGDMVTSFSLACGWKSKTGEGVEWVNVVAFGKLAEICNQYLKKGSQVFIQGRMKTDKYEKDGQTHYSTKIIADKMQMLGSKPESIQEPDNAQYSHAPGSQKQSPATSQSSGTGGFVDMEDDIPFIFNMNTVTDVMGEAKGLIRARHGK